MYIGILNCNNKYSNEITTNVWIIYLPLPFQVTPFLLTNKKEKETNLYKWINYVLILRNYILTLLFQVTIFSLTNKKKEKKPTCYIRKCLVNV